MSRTLEADYKRALANSLLNVWWYKQRIRVETPQDLTMDEWKLLTKYVECVKPDESTPESTEAP